MKIQSLILPAALCAGATLILGVYTYTVSVKNAAEDRQWAQAQNDAEAAGNKAPQVFAAAKKGRIIELTDKFYVTYINDIFLNQQDYIGRTLRLQGAYAHPTCNYYNGSHAADFVYRNGPGCCGNDGAMCGFEFDNPDNVPLKENDWIEVTGVFGTYSENGVTFTKLSNCTVKVLPVRGSLTVTN